MSKTFNTGEGMGTPQSEWALAVHSHTVASGRCGYVTQSPCRGANEYSCPGPPSLPGRNIINSLTSQQFMSKYLHFARLENGAQRGTVTCLKPHSRSVVGLDSSQVSPSLTSGLSPHQLNCLPASLR